MKCTSGMRACWCASRAVLRPRMTSAKFIMCIHNWPQLIHTTLVLIIVILLLLCAIHTHIQVRHDTRWLSTLWRRPGRPGLRLSESAKRPRLSVSADAPELLLRLPFGQLSAGLRESSERRWVLTNKRQLNCDVTGQREFVFNAIYSNRGEREYNWCGQWGSSSKQYQYKYTIYDVHCCWFSLIRNNQLGSWLMNLVAESV